MDFEFFEKLTKSEAVRFLEEFLAFGENVHREMASAADLDGVRADFSISSIAPTLLWLLSKCKIKPEPEDLNVPEWIRRTEIYANSCFYFAAPSKPLILYGGFYMGQAMVLRREGLRWSTGNPLIAEKNMPVVCGLRVSDMAPILVVENLFSRIIREPNKANDIEAAIDSWLSRAPKTI